jgi:protein-disulfide isomerase
MTNQALSGSRRVSWRTLLDIVATLGSVTAAGALLWMIFLAPAPPPPAGRPAPPVPTEPVSLDGAPMLGSAAAPVVMLEFSDFECPFCEKFVTETWPQIKAKYVDTGQLQLAFKNLPLPIHKRAQPAAESAVCAGEQQKFWPYHDQLFRAAGKLEDADLQRYAVGLGIEPTQFARCLAGPAAVQVQHDAATAKALKLTGTPSFLVGRRSASGELEVAEILVGARPLADFEQAFLRVLKG